MLFQHPLMIIPNPVIKLDFDPATDILFVEWPDFTEFTISESEYILDAIIETVNSYDVSYLITDTRNGMVKISDQRYKELIYNFALKLGSTRLKKLARLVTEATVREPFIKEVTQKAYLTLPLRNFTTYREAVTWLKEKQ